MQRVELVGYLASALVFVTFYMKTTVPLRLIAIASNIAFIAYGYLGDMMPILLLHAGLLPLNLWRVCQTLRPVNRLRRSTPDAGLSVKFLRLRKVSGPHRGSGLATDRAILARQDQLEDDDTGVLRRQHPVGAHRCLPRLRSARVRGGCAACAQCPHRPGR
jgi:hypothetical protein